MNGASHALAWLIASIGSVAKLRSHRDAASQLVGSTIAVVVCLMPSAERKGMRQTAGTMAVICQARLAYCANQVCCFAMKR